MIVHLHASCWNEERMLPFFFRHYDRFVDRYFIHDNQSSDGSLDILGRHPRVTVLPLHLDGDSLVESGFAQVNRFWHRSRGEADWVAVCNVDEFFWHADPASYLDACRRRGITWLTSIGYQMVSETFPEAGDDLPRTIRFGARDRMYDKPAFFNPDAIADSGFRMARHGARPQGRVVPPLWRQMLLLHYKYIGVDYVVARHAELDRRRREKDVAEGFGWQYGSKATLAQLSRHKAASREVLPPAENRFPNLAGILSKWPLARWW